MKLQELINELEQYESKYPGCEVVLVTRGDNYNQYHDADERYPVGPSGHDIPKATIVGK